MAARTEHAAPAPDPAAAAASTSAQAGASRSQTREDGEIGHDWCGGHDSSGRKMCRASIAASSAHTHAPVPTRGLALTVGGRMYGGVETEMAAEGAGAEGAGADGVGMEASWGEGAKAEAAARSADKRASPMRRAWKKARVRLSRSTCDDNGGWIERARAG